MLQLFAVTNANPLGKCWSRCKECLYYLLTCPFKLVHCMHAFINCLDWYKIADKREHICWCKWQNNFQFIVTLITDINWHATSTLCFALLDLLIFGLLAKKVALQGMLNKKSSSKWAIKSRWATSKLTRSSVHWCLSAPVTNSLGDGARLAGRAMSSVFLFGQCHRDWCESITSKMTWKAANYVVNSFDI